MPALLAAFIAVSQSADIDPYRLRIGRRGEVRAEVGQITNLETGKAATVADIVRASRGKRFVYLGEQHKTAAHQNLQAEIIRALADSGRRVIVGLEMITRPKQDVLDLWSAGKLEEGAFLEQVDWKGQWGYDFAFYRPIFAAAREKSIPLVALNVPRDWVRAVGRGGLSALPTSARLQLPAEIFLGNREHRKAFDALMGGHPMTGPQGENVYAAQVLWDEGMADTALKYLERVSVSADTAFVVLAGSGHSMYGQGINSRVVRRRGGSGITVTMAGVGLTSVARVGGFLVCQRTCGVAGLMPT